MNFKKILEKFISESKTDSLIVKDYPKFYEDYVLKVSFGKGRVAKSPWIAFLKNQNEIRKGIYPIIILYKAHNLICIAYGVSTYFQPSYNWKFIDKKKTIGEFYNELGFNNVQYADSYIAQSFPIDNLDFISFNKELTKVLNEYKNQE